LGRDDRKGRPEKKNLGESKPDREHLDIKGSKKSDPPKDYI